MHRLRIYLLSAKWALLSIFFVVFFNKNLKMQRFAPGACQISGCSRWAELKSSKNGAKCNKGGFYVVLLADLRHLTISGTDFRLVKALFLKNLL